MTNHQTQTQPNPPQPRPPRTEHARLAAGGMVCTVDHLASAAGARLLADGGSAADAAVAASAVLAVTTQHLCGMGGDLWAVVHEAPDGPPAGTSSPDSGHDGSGDGGSTAPRSIPTALNASGRAGSGADAGQLRAEGHTTMPFRGDIRSVPVPGCVDGWLALHARYGRAPLADVLAPAIALASDGFAVSPILGTRTSLVADVEGADDFLIGGRPARAGEIVRRPGLARSLRAIAADGRDPWYGGEFGQGLIRVGAGLYTADDLARRQADWVEPVAVDAWGHRLWTTPPNSQGYLSLAGAVIADGLDLPADPDDPRWAHLLVESAKQAAADRLAVLHEHADGAALVAGSRLGPRRDAISPTAARLTPPAGAGDTIYLCTIDRDRQAVSLIQSNAAGFGVHLTVPEVGVFLHNRGVGFSLAPGHPAELAPGRRPPSTLSPALVTNPADGSVRAVLGTMGGDAQPQVVLQMLARLLHAGQPPGKVITAPRFALTVPDAVGFDTWHHADKLAVAIERGSPWAPGLTERGHQVVEQPWGTATFGHAHLIDVDGSLGSIAGVADPRALTGAAIGT